MRGRLGIGSDGVTSQGPLEPSVSTCHIPGMSRAKRPCDANLVAELVVEVATVQHEVALTTEAANEFARIGGIKGGEAQAAGLSP